MDPNMCKAINKLASIATRKTLCYPYFHGFREEYLTIHDASYWNDVSFPQSCCEIAHA